MKPSIIIALLFAATMLSQSVERPPRPGEVESPPKPVKPAVEREYRKRAKLQPTLSVSGGAIVYPQGTFGCVRAGARLRSFGFGLGAGYFDYERNFEGSRISYMSDGDLPINERGSAFCPSIYADWRISLGRLVFIPRGSLGYADLVVRRVDESSPTDTSRFERSRMTNIWGLDCIVPIGRLDVGIAVAWWVVNPWFYLYPKDFGLLSVGAVIGI